MVYGIHVAYLISLCLRPTSLDLFGMQKSCSCDIIRSLISLDYGTWHATFFFFNDGGLPLSRAHLWCLGTMGFFDCHV